ncbi:Solute carrier 26 [Nowakowskiella sp. JEL0078]|nr:Solute carrier 26 [Nowakowskiella sp. JEL0078]
MKEKHNDVYDTVKYFFPIVGEIANYNLKLFGSDLLAAVTVTMVIIPQAIAYSSLAGVNPINALLSAVYPIFIYAIFGSSKQLSVGPEALSSVLVGIAVSEVSRDTGLDQTYLASTLALIVGLFTMILAFLRAGFIDNILSGYLLTGFVTGVAILIITEQLPGLLGISYTPPVGEVSTLNKLILTGNKFYTANIPTVIVGLTNVVFLIAIQRIKKHFSPRWKFGGKYLRVLPEVFILVVIMISISAGIDLKNNFKIKILGVIDNFLIPPSAPPFNGDLIQRLLEPAIIIVIVGYIESQTVTRNFGLKNNYFPSGDRELFALGASNLVGSFFGTYVTFGSLPRSRILANAGSKTTIAGILISILVLCSILGLGPVLAFLPKPTLAAIVFVAAYNLIEWGEIFFVFKLQGWVEIFFMVSTFVITFVAPISYGIILCIIFASLIIVRHSTHLDMIILGRVPLSGRNFKFDASSLNDSTITETPSIISYRYVNIKEHPEAIIYDNLLIVGIDSPLLFYNAGSFRRSLETLLLTEKILIYKQNNSTNCLGSVGSESDVPDHSVLNVDSKSTDCVTVSELIKEAAEHGVKPTTVHDEAEDPTLNSTKTFENSISKKYAIVISFKYCTDIDSAAAHILRSIVRSFLKHNTRICLTNLHRYHRKIFENAGIIQLIGSNNVFNLLDDAVSDALGEVVPSSDEEKIETN